MNFSTSCYSPGDNSVQKMETSDVTWFVRPDEDSCPNRHVTTSNEIYPTVESVEDDDDDEFSFLSKGALFVISMSLLVICFGLLLTIAFLWNKLSVKESDLDSIHNGDYKSMFDESTNAIA